MIKNFEEIKKQLGELASVINAFKSEAVQLRIIELVLGAAGDVDGGTAQTTEVAEGQIAPKTRSRRRRAKTAEATPLKEGVTPIRRRGTGSGPVSTLETLIAEGFFKNRQTIGQIVEHSRSSKARQFKPNEISGPLGRLIRAGKLKREKNADGQFEYFV